MCWFFNGDTRLSRNSKSVILKSTSPPSSNFCLLYFHLDLSLFDRRYQYRQEEEKTQINGSSESRTWNTYVTVWAKVKCIKIAFHTERLRFWTSRSRSHGDTAENRQLMWRSGSLSLIPDDLRKNPRRACAFWTNSVSTAYLLPVNAIHRAYFVASLRQWEATSKPQVTVNEMIPMMIKNSVVTHSGGSRGGMHVRSRPWIVWHCRTRPTVSAPGGDAKAGIF